MLSGPYRFASVTGSECTRISRVRVSAARSRQLRVAEGGIAPKFC